MCISIYIYIYFYLSIYLSFYLSIYISIYLSIYIYMYIHKQYKVNMYGWWFNFHQVLVCWCRPWRAKGWSPGAPGWRCCRWPGRSRRCETGRFLGISGWRKVCFFQIILAMDWLKGKFTGNHRFSHKIWGFPVNFPLIQSILATKRLFYWKKQTGYIMMYIYLVYVSPLLSWTPAEKFKWIPQGTYGWKHEKTWGFHLLLERKREFTENTAEKVWQQWS